MVWEQFDSTLWNIWANRFDGISWGIAELLETNDSENATDPQIAINVEGNAIAVWEQSDNTLWNIMAKRFNGSSWGIVAPINSVDSGETGYAQIAMDGSGKAIAVWHQFDGIRFNIWANRFSGSSWGTAELIETNDTSDMAFPQIACNADGYAMVVWNQYNGYRYDIWANSFDGFSWGTSELVETDDTGNARYPQIAIDNNGNAIAVWSQYVGTRYNIWANHFYDSSWGVAEFIENNDSVGPSVPQIAIDTSGNAIAIWSQFDGSYDSIYTNRYQ